MNPDEFMKLMSSQGMVDLTVPGHCTFTCRVMGCEITNDPDSSWVTRYTFSAVIEDLPRDLLIISGQAEVSMPVGYENIPCYIYVLRVYNDDIVINTMGGESFSISPPPEQRMELEFSVYADALDIVVVKEKENEPYNRFDILDFGD